jgi:hypothetical protein
MNLAYLLVGHSGDVVTTKEYDGVDSVAFWTECGDLAHSLGAESPPDPKLQGKAPKPTESL